MFGVRTVLCPITELSLLFEFRVELLALRKNTCNARINRHRLLEGGRGYTAVGLIDAFVFVIKPTAVASRISEVGFFYSNI